MIQWINSNSTLIAAAATAATAIATASLAILTYLYIREIRKQTQAHREEIHNQIKETAKPKLSVKMTGTGCFELENVGRGIAYNIKVIVVALNPSFYEGVPLAPNEFFRIVWQADSLANHIEKTLPIEVKYKDIYSNEYQEIINAMKEFDTDAHNASLCVEMTSGRNPKFIIRLRDL